MEISAGFIVLLLASGLIWLSDALFFKPKRRRVGEGSNPHEGLNAREPLLVHYARAFFPVILIVLLIRAFVFEPFRIPSASMMPGLVNGDLIFVAKFSYGLRVPLINTKILSTGEPRRGDVIVFRLPADPSVHYIKRLIGLPGDHVLIRDNQIFINGSQIAQRADGVYAGEDGFAGSDLALERMGSEDHVVMFARDRMATDFEADVPAGRYFFMGDNRNDSEDGRFPMVGFVPEKNLVGHAVRIVMNWPLPGWPDWRRIGRKIS